MTSRRNLPHADRLDESLTHFNEAFRHVYRLPPLQLAWLETRDDFPEAWDSIGTVRADGATDAPCTVLARIALGLAPRYGVGFLDRDGRAHIQAPLDGDKEAYRGHAVLLVNPIGGYDNWSEVARWVRTHGGNKARRSLLAQLASERRPDYASIDRLLRENNTERAQILPPDESFSAARAAEVSYIYDVPIDTLRSWKQKLRKDLAGGKPGRPQNR